MGLVTRQIGPDAKGSKLTFADMDNNLYYLQSFGVSGMTFSANTLTLINPTGGTIFVTGITQGVSSNYLPLSGGTVSGSTNFTSGLTTNTISATTYQNLPVSGITEGTNINVSGSNGNFTISVTGITGGGVIEATYSELYDKITASTLSIGSYYLITDFRTCYDQPDYNFAGSAITTGNYKQGPIKPIVVLSTSANTISNIAYQPTYPNDKITYDWTWNQTEITNGPAKGRITERIDEFNNRTDYDHRVVLFRRYDNYYYKENNIAEGTIELIENTGEVIGTETLFSNYNVGDHIAIPNTNVTFFEVVSISGDTSMVVSGLTIPAVSSGASFYLAQKDGLTYKQNNISVQYTEHPTFLFDDETIISNYIGDVAIFRNWSEHDFLLPNNVFGENVIGNRIGNEFINNTFNSDVEHNVIGDQFENNTIYNDEDFTDNQIGVNFRNNLIVCDDFNDNVIGDDFYNNKIFDNSDFINNQIGVGFNDNTIYDNFEDNKIGNGFYSNVIDGSFNDNSIGNEFNNNEIFTKFYDNLIANEFNNNTIYSDFYKNQILDNFNYNVIGDFSNYGNFEFYRNYIRNNFNENVIRQDFQNNQIGTNFQVNEINGEFKGNTILNGFNSNTIGSYFVLNNIGNGFNKNTIYDDFYHNTTDDYFNDNIISNNFNTNKVGTYFVDNIPSNENLFGWNDLSTVSARTYDTLRISLNNSVGSYILGKELVMRVISTQQYFRIKFTQWTQGGNGGGNGGGFRYERQELDSNGNTTGSTVVFTKTNYGSEVDVLVPNVVELTRDSQGGLYNTITDTPPFNNQWPGPGDTEWNSIYTQSNNGERFAYNKIGNNFRSNTIDSDFGYGGGEPYGNIINDNFENNTIGQFAYNNVIGNEFKDNTVGDNFGYNTIENDFKNNTIGDSFGGNDIENFFSANSIGDSFAGNDIENVFSGNSIGNIFTGNSIGNFFGTNSIGDNFVSNNIGNEFNDNTLGDYFRWNVFNTSVNSVDFTINYGNITGFSYTALGSTAQDDIYTDLIGTTNGNGVNATFNVEVSGNTVIGVSGASQGKLYICGDTITISGTEIEGYNNAIDTYSDNINSQTGSTGTYFDISATGGTGVNATFEVEVDEFGVISTLNIQNLGSGYTNGDLLVIVGSLFGGTDGVDDITITITNLITDNIQISVGVVSPDPSVYEGYTCNIFERKGGNKRLSYYDESDVLTIKNINE